jgi:hypothetical protein
MPKSEKIRIMISSRCTARISYKDKPTLFSEVRIDIKKDVESVRLWPRGRQLFECWINEDGASAPIGDETWWSHSKLQARQADVVIVLYNGESGGGIKGEPMGICHAELEEALATQSGKVRGIQLPMAGLSADSAARKQDKVFREYVEKLDIFRGAAANTGEEVIERVRQEVQQAVVDMSQRSGVTPNFGSSNVGDALEWHRLSYEGRAEAINTDVAATLLDRPDSEQLDKKRLDLVTVKLASRRLLMSLHAVPAALSQPAARERVGQPFLFDHGLQPNLADCHGGPVHIVACYKGCTEGQALKMLGFPDAIVIPGTFGLHIADAVQKIQLVLLKNCDSPTATRRAVAEWMEWLQRSGEDRLVVERAAARKRIIEAIAKENARR